MSAKVHVRSDGATRLKLACALLVYGDGRGAAYATIHGIQRGVPGAAGPVLGAGTPATRDSIAKLVRELGERSGFSGFLSDRMLYSGAGVTAWWRPPSRERVYFARSPSDASELIGDRSGVTPHPGLVFALAGRGWHVFAVKGAARPTPATPLFRAPYFNVDRGGWICEGDLRRPAEVTPEALADFERAFFASRFTHPNMHGRRDMASFAGGPHAFWKALLDGRWKSFPERYLVPVRRRLETRLKDLEKRNGRD